ncbi:alpha/beta fold hydrolase [Halobaculum magnesiiphilum]|uniref:alpha/beta fold hydrolase n=1 Tax=Halobaculum magnesiiphilum TaxID=1017351 RepID=UPI001CEC79E1|nr:alpha/beta hydrolase [Halobaculum magnesiiphilum]
MEHPGDQFQTVTLADDKQLAYAQYGDADGTPVLFFHGTPGSRLLGSLLEPAARERGIRVIAPDRPGFGRSDPWSDRSIRDAGSVVRAVLDDVNVETAGIIAFSGGSPHALAAATTHGDRVREVDIVAGATPSSVTEEPPFIQRLLSGLATTAPLVLRGLFRGQTWLARRSDPSFVVEQYTASGNTDAIPEDAARLVKADFLEAFARCRSGAVTEFKAAATDWEVLLQDIDTKIRFWHGDTDTNVPIKSVRRLQSQLPTAQLRVLDDADHIETLLRSVPDVLEHHR